ncbi:MAG: GGDEF domain-containing protein [Roseburia sp.]
MIKDFIQHQITRYREYPEEYNASMQNGNKRIARINILVAGIYALFLLLVQFMEWQIVVSEIDICLCVVVVSLISHFLFDKFFPKHVKLGKVYADLYIFFVINLLIAAKVSFDGTISYVLVVSAVIGAAAFCVLPLHFWLIIFFTALLRVLPFLFLENRKALDVTSPTFFYYVVDDLLMLALAVGINYMFANLKYKEISYEQSLLFEARTDPMTRLFNRGYMERCVQSCIDMNKAGAMICIDLDNFKKVNDVLGHKMGDEVLIEASRILKRSFRETDYVARIGGDEFLIFMKDVQDCDSIITRVQDLLRHFPIIASEEGSEKVPVSLSVGVSFLREGSRCTYETLYKSSDQAMYQAKNSGKGRAVIRAKTLQKDALVVTKDSIASFSNT